MIQISIVDGATPALREAVNQLTFAKAQKVAAAAVRVRIRTHLAERQRQPNKQGWKKQDWFKRARDRVEVKEGPQGSYVSIDLPGFAMRYTGNPAVILPVNAKALAIPISAAAYGRRPAEFKDLVFVPVLRGRTIGLLVQQISVGSAKVWVNLFRLVKYVRVKADKTLLPTDAELLEAASTAIQKQAALAVQ